MLSLEGVNVSIGPVAILRGVNLDVRAGEFAGLIGRNGAGKTTVLRTIMGLLPSASGRLEFEQEPLAGLPTHRRAGLGQRPAELRAEQPNPACDDGHAARQIEFFLNFHHVPLWMCSVDFIARRFMGQV